MYIYIYIYIYARPQNDRGSHVGLVSLMASIAKPPRMLSTPMETTTQMYIYIYIYICMHIQSPNSEVVYTIYIYIYIYYIYLYIHRHVPVVLNDVSNSLGLRVGREPPQT